ncbi:putative laccase [Helianthus anomalus]
MLGLGKTTNVLMTTDQPIGHYHIVARTYASAQGAPFDNTPLQLVWGTNLQLQSKLRCLSRPLI